MRIAIVNDLMMALESLRRIILSVSGHEIAWVAKDGDEAVRKCANDVPDLILMDLVMPRMDGVAATRKIMEQSPCPILIVTATVGEHAAMVFEAMGYGALDAVNVPMMGSGAAAQRSRYTLLRKIHIIAKLQGLASNNTLPESAVSLDHGQLPPLVIIGASTGGPKALAEILKPLPETLNAAIVIVQHVDERFSAGLAEWLDGQTRLRVLLAPEGDEPRVGRVYIAGTNDHLIMSRSRTFSYTSEPGNISYRPSVDVFFHSVAKHWPMKDNQQPCIAVLLTGMGKDGALGLATLRRLGWHTVVQDEASSVVFGMPKAALEIGAAKEVLPLDRIGSEIIAQLERSNPKNG